jgi:hypothetical protein
MSWYLVHAALEVLHLKEFQSDIRRGTLSKMYMVRHTRKIEKELP